MPATAVRSALVGQGVGQGVYGTHCHQAKEIYIPIDPMAYAKKYNPTLVATKYLGTSGYFREEGYFYNTNSYMASSPNAAGQTPAFGPFYDMWNVVQDRRFRTVFIEVTNGDVVYLDSLTKHAMYTGRRFQFAAWVRVDRPWEGTYFPYDIDGAAADNTPDQETGEPYANTCRDVVPVKGSRKK